MELIDPNGRCAPYYKFASSFDNDLIKDWVYEMFPQ